MSRLDDDDEVLHRDFSDSEDTEDAADEPRSDQSNNESVLNCLCSCLLMSDVKGPTPFSQASGLDEVKMRPCHWLGYVRCVSFIISNCWKDICFIKPVPLICKGFLPECMEEKTAANPGSPGNGD